MSKSARLQDMPEEFLPREKLISRGRGSLSHSELIALFLRTGIKGRNVLEVASDLITAAGSLEALARMDTRQIADACKGIGLAKAATLAAAFELGARAMAEPSKSMTMNDPALVYDFLSPKTRWVSQEMVFVLMVDTRMNLIAWEEVTRGILNESIVHPREILRPVLLNKAYGFILAHNHPSGDPSPSAADRELTRVMKDAGALMDVPLLDHVILGKPMENGRGPFYSFRREKEM